MGTAIGTALSTRCSDAAIRHLAQAADLGRARSTLVELGALSLFERPLSVLTDYDCLLGHEAPS